MAPKGKDPDVTETSWDVGKAGKSDDDGVVSVTAVFELTCGFDSGCTFSESASLEQAKYYLKTPGEIKDDLVSNLECRQ